MIPDMRPTYQINYKELNICLDSIAYIYYKLILLDIIFFRSMHYAPAPSISGNLWWQPCQVPRKETALSGTLALELETELLE